MGEAASPVCFELAKRLKRAPRQIAQEIANGLPKVEGIAKVDVAGGGDFYPDFDPAVFLRQVFLYALPPFATPKTPTPRKGNPEPTHINTNNTPPPGPA